MTKLDSKKWEKIIVIEERSFIGSATGRKNGTHSVTTSDRNRQREKRT